MVIGQIIEKDSYVLIKAVDDKKVFSLGEQVKFSAQEFADITWGLFAFGSDVVKKIGAAGQEKGFLTPRTPVNNTLQGTFDPWPICAAARMAPASNAPERGRWTS